jgi:hypothetical protein
MPKLSRKQLIAVKNILKRTKNNEQQIENKDEQVTTLSEAKKIAKELNSQDENYKNYQKDKKALKEIKRKASVKKIQVEWNINIGDAVKYKNALGNEVFGIVIEQRADGEYRSMHHAKWSGYVQVMSSEGKLWLSPKQIDKIND